MAAARKKPKHENLALARAVKAAKRHLASRPIVLELNRADAQWLLEHVDGEGHETAVKIRRALVAQAFG